MSHLRTGRAENNDNRNSRSNCETTSRLRFQTLPILCIQFGHYTGWTGRSSPPGRAAHSKHMVGFENLSTKDAEATPVQHCSAAHAIDPLTG